jgi:hypothetical protein
MPQYRTRGKKKAARQTVRLKEIVAASFTTTTGSSYSLLGLSTNGRVYRYDPKCEAWIPWSDKIATCKKDHKAGR